MIEKTIHLVIGTPCYGGQVTSAYFSSILKLQEACRNQGFGLTVLMPEGNDLVQKVRQEIMADFMQIQGSTHLLFIDADIGFEPDQVFRLLHFQAEVVAAVYPLKNIDWEKVRSAVQAGWEKLESSGLHYVLEVLQPPKIHEGFLRVLSTGSGFFMMKRTVLASLMERHPELRYLIGNGKKESARWAYAFFNCRIDGVDGPYLSEDYSFCRLLTQNGFDIWADLNSQLIHQGSAFFAGNLNAGPPQSKDSGGEV